MKIPFHVPVYDETDAAALAQSIASGSLVGDGPATRRATAALARDLGVRHALLTPSCTHALELAMMALTLDPGDEVIVPSFTFVSSTNAILRRGARVVFADVDPATLTLTADEVRARITPRTRAIMPVVYAGVSPDVDPIMALAISRSITVIEDAAQGIAAQYRGKPAGTTGHMGCFSFHETKNFSTGEGGAFVTNDDALIQRAEIMREKGTNRKQFMLGLVDKYTWVDVGSSFLPPDTMAALMESQMAKRNQIQSRRRTIFERYTEAFTPLAQEGRLTLPVIPSYAGSNHHIYHVLMENESTRNRALAFFREKEIGTTFHYLPLHLSPMGRAMGYAEGDLPVTESVSGRLLRLPIYPSLTEAQQETVIGAMKEFFA
jgi:dTDP-4-amino-4,6-dideoxygalactose transaminase